MSGNDIGAYGLKHLAGLFEENTTIIDLVSNLFFIQLITNIKIQIQNFVLESSKKLYWFNRNEAFNRYF